MREDQPETSYLEKFPKNQRKCTKTPKFHQIMLKVSQQIPKNIDLLKPWKFVTELAGLW